MTKNTITAPGKIRKDEKEKAPEPMSREDIKPRVRLNDLCIACAKADSCIYRKDNKHAVWDCDEYDTISTPVDYIRTAPAFDPTAPRTSMGLCTTCEHKADCTLAKPASGIWHCEEYK